MKIVIVEEDAETREDLSLLIASLDPAYEVAGLASDGREGLELIIKECPDLVITAIGLPKMDGLTLLAELRSRRQNFRAVIITSHTEFDYMQRAVCLGIENYMLKPVNPDELSDTLKKVYDEFIKDEETDKIRARFLSLEQITRSLILTELPIDEDLRLLLRERYDLDADGPLTLFTIWLGNHFEEDHERVAQIVESYAGKALDYRHVTIPSFHYRAILMMLYRMEDPMKLYQRSLKTVSPALIRNLEHPPVITWTMCSGIENLPAAFEKSINARKWNLSLPPGSVINADIVDPENTVHISFPLQKEEEIRAVVAERNLRAYHRMINGLKDECRNGDHNPDEIREICVRFCLAILSETQVIGRVYPVISRQKVVSRLDRAVTWENIEGVFEEVYQSVAVDEEMGKNLSPLIHRALSLIEESYTQGLTLEELARKLGVSQEYLSAQFKKETGLTFKETVRRYQITKVKELLLQSDLKLNKIAELSGYSDPKYMSKVFKEEVGMLPSEFRSQNR